MPISNHLRVRRRRDEIIPADARLRQTQRFASRHHPAERLEARWYRTIQVLVRILLLRRGNFASAFSGVPNRQHMLTKQSYQQIGISLLHVAHVIARPSGAA
jgi:hypothetical protein